MYMCVYISVCMHAGPLFASLSCSSAAAAAAAAAGASAAAAAGIRRAAGRL